MSKISTWSEYLYTNQLFVPRGEISSGETRQHLDQVKIYHQWRAEGHTPQRPTMWCPKKDTTSRVGFWPRTHNSSNSEEITTKLKMGHFLLNELEEPIFTKNINDIKNKGESWQKLTMSDTAWKLHWVGRTLWRTLLDRRWVKVSTWSGACPVVMWEDTLICRKSALTYLGVKDFDVCNVLLKCLSFLWREKRRERNTDKANKLICK